MFKNKSIRLVAVLLILALALVGCGKKETAGGGDTPGNEMQYVKAEELKKSLEDGTNEYVILDVRKTEDFNESHIVGSYIADQDPSTKGGDDETGKENLKAALKEATGSETGSSDAKYVLICYSGKSYAQKGTDLLIELGVSPEQIYTLQGGIKPWQEGVDDFKALLSN